jgi:hypothetical protein
MGRPLLPTFAKGFAEHFRDRIEAEVSGAPATDHAPKPSLIARFWNWLLGLFGKRT